MNLDELEKLLAAATPGEWRAKPMGGSSTVLVEAKPRRNDRSIPAFGYDDGNGHCIAYPFLDDNGTPRRDFVCFSHEDAAAIDALHNAAPSLIADNRRLAERAAGLEEALRETQRRTGLLMHQNTGRWNATIEHDRRTMDVLQGNQDIARKALEASHD